ncbi:hypothetical protein [Microbacterium sp. 10M-3C3]|jgi:hypothetical protein|uniref:hypothetical protein n=1 Tax=Microbacterium sp. 10M-3C3 TaxID=2483401 RepID=UPI000F630078|nr:hypothetical protein [Microbacterium sp. 10M-3C3]
MTSALQRRASREPRPAGVLGWTAFVAACVAFLIGWLPVAGLVLGAAALVLSAVALFQRRPVWMGLLGLILGGLATVTGLVTTIGLVALLNLPTAP